MRAAVLRAACRPTPPWKPAAFIEMKFPGDNRRSAATETSKKFNDRSGGP
jgi:hypothetical protein